MIELNDEVEQRLARAVDDGHPLNAAYVDVTGKPHIGFYGSTHVHSADELAIWVRNAQSALLQTLPERPHITFSYGDVGSRVYYIFEGTGRVSADAAESERVYGEMHEIERRFDPDANGVAVIVQLDRFTSMSVAGKEIQERGGA